MFRGQMQSFDFCSEPLYQENCMVMLRESLMETLVKAS